MSKDGVRALSLAAAGLFLLYPLWGLFVPVGRWDWAHAGAPGALATSLGLTGVALVIVVAVGTPLAFSLRTAPRPLRTLFEAIVLLSVLMPPLALGLLLALAFGPRSAVGAALLRLGIPTSNSSTAFVVTQVYASLGYYLLGATAAFDAVPQALEQSAALLGAPPAQVFWHITLPLARLGLGAAASLAWVRALGEFGAIMVTAYYPHGIPVELWVDLQDQGLPTVLPLLLIFLLCALPVPWLLRLVARSRGYA